MPTIIKPQMRPLLSTRAIADVLSVSLDFMYTEIQSGEVRAIKVGREYRIEAAEAVRYLTALQAPVPDEWQ